MIELAKKKMTKTAKRRLTVLTPIVILAIGYCAFTLVTTAFHLYQLHHEEKQLKEELNDLKGESKDLKNEIRKLICEKKEWFYLLSRKQQLLAHLICEVPIIYPILYKTYSTFLLKDKYR